MRWIAILSCLSVAVGCVGGCSTAKLEDDVAGEAEPTPIAIAIEDDAVSRTDERESALVERLLAMLERRQMDLGESGHGDQPSEIELANYIDVPLKRLDIAHTIASPTGFNSREASRLASHLSADARAALQGSLRAYQTKADVLIHNVANADTVGFKRRSVVMEDVDYRQLVAPGVEDSDGNLAASGQFVGHGCRVAEVRIDFTQGPLRTTDQILDLAITGEGFFQVADFDARGGVLYTRAGSFSVNANGELVIGSARSGRLLEPAVTIPRDAVDVTISNDGLVTITAADGTATSAGTIQLASFINPAGLQPVGENLFAETDASGTSTAGDPGSVGLGEVQQGALEMSNAEPVRELCELAETLRTLKLIRRLLAIPWDD